MKDYVSQDVNRLDAALLRESIRRVDTLDCDPLVEVLTQPAPDGVGWSNHKALIAVEEYKRFLNLNALYPSERIVPNRMVDEVWHTHILDTRKYAADCQQILGFFLHHFPYFGQRGDSEQRDAAFETTQVLYAKAFGEASIGKTLIQKIASAEAAGCDAGDIRPAGCDAGDIRASGCDAGDIRPAGCDAGDIRPAGCDAGDIRASGCDAGDIRPAGCDAGDIRPAGCDAGDIRPAGFDVENIRPADYDAGDIRA